MALSDLAVYSEYAYSSMTEVLDYQVNLFNQATQGAIVLGAGAHQGDFSDKAFFGLVPGVVRRRNAYGAGAVPEKNMFHLVDTMVKVAAGTPPMRIDPGQFKWIQQDPKTAGAAFGIQVAKETMADMLNTSLGATIAALSSQPEVVFDATDGASPEDTMTFANQNRAQALFGDASSNLVAWVMSSKALFDLYGAAITNAAHLFTYGTVRVIADPMGRPMVMTDSPSLVNDDVYSALLLTAGGITVNRNNDYTTAEETKTGDENIIHVLQSEWSYQLGIKGFSWDKSAGGASPNDAALLSSANWKRFSTSHKDLAGVLVETH